MEAPEKIYFGAQAVEPFYGLTRKCANDDIEYTRTDAFIKKACEAFCKVRCNGHPPRSTCTSLGTCLEHDQFRKALKGN